MAWRLRLGAAIAVWLCAWLHAAELLANEFTLLCCPPFILFCFVWGVCGLGYVYAVPFIHFIFRARAHAGSNRCGARTQYAPPQESMQTQQTLRIVTLGFAEASAAPQHQPMSMSMGAASLLPSGWCCTTGGLAQGELTKPLLCTACPTISQGSISSISVPPPPLCPANCCCCQGCKPLAPPPAPRSGLSLSGSSSTMQEGVAVELGASELKYRVLSPGGVPQHASTISAGNATGRLMGPVPSRPPLLPMPAAPSTPRWR